MRDEVIAKEIERTNNNNKNGYRKLHIENVSGVNANEKQLFSDTDKSACALR